MVETRSTMMEYELMDPCSHGVPYPTRRNGETTSFQKAFGGIATAIMLQITSDGGVHMLLELVRSLTSSRYSTEPFASANGQIPQLNLWDDHDVCVKLLSLLYKFQYLESADVFRLSMDSGLMSLIL